MEGSNPDGARAAEILDAVETLVLRHRTLALSFGEISEQVGISRSLIYVYYDTVAAMIEALFLNHLESVERDMQRAVTDTESFRIRALARATAYMNYCVERGAFLQLVLREASGDSPLGPQARAQFRHAMRRLAGETAQGLQVSPREAFVILELIAAIPESLARMVVDEALDRDTATQTCERLVGAAIDSLAMSSAD